MTEGGISAKKLTISIYTSLYALNELLNIYSKGHQS